MHHEYHCVWIVEYEFWSSHCMLDAVEAGHTMIGPSYYSERWQALQISVIKACQQSPEIVLCNCLSQRRSCLCGFLQGPKFRKTRKSDCTCDVCLVLPADVFRVFKIPMQHSGWAANGIQKGWSYPNGWISGLSRTSNYFCICSGKPHIIDTQATLRWQVHLQCASCQLCARFPTLRGDYDKVDENSLSSRILAHRHSADGI